MLAGHKANDAIDLPEDHQFPSCSLDEAWHGFPVLVRRLYEDPHRGWNDVVTRYEHEVRQKLFQASFWEAQEVCWTNDSFAMMAQDLFPHENLTTRNGKRFPYRSRGNVESCWSSILPPSELARACELLLPLLIETAAHSGNEDLENAPDYHAALFLDYVRFMHRASLPAVSALERPMWGIVRLTS